MIDVEIISPSGNRQSINSSEHIADNTKFAIERSLFFIAKQLKTEFNRQVLDKSGKTGTIYIRRDKLGRRRKHRSSAPGETPANRTGHYRKSIGWNVNGNELTFGNAAKYAGYLELGTSRMKPRPGLKNTIKSSERDIIKILANGIEEAI